MRHNAIIILLSVLMLSSCEQPKPEQRPSGLKNMAPPSIQEAVQDGQDVEPNNTFLQAVDVTMTGDVMHWAGSLSEGDVDVWQIKAKAGTVADILVTPESQVDLMVEYAPTAQASKRYYDVAPAGGAEQLPNIKLTPQGGYVTVRGRNLGETVKYRLSVSRVTSRDGGSVVEAEPNDQRVEGLLVTMPNRVEGAVYPAGDVDYWRVPLSMPSVIQFAMPDGGYEVAVEHQGQVIWSSISKHAQILKSNILKSELQEVYVRLKSLEDVGQVNKYTFEVSALEKVPDEIEPNNTMELAQKIQGISQSLEFSLSDSADVDIFYVSLEPGYQYSARLVGPESGQARIQVLSSSGLSRGDVLGDGQAICHASLGEDGGLWLKVMPGVGVMSWPLSYRIVMDAIPVEFVEHEPNQQLEQAQEIAPGGTVKGHIFPVGDVDIYKVVLPEFSGVEGPIGTLNIDVEGGYVAQLRLMLQDAAGYEISQARNSQYSRPIHLAFDAPNGVYTLAVSGSGDQCVKPYTLKVSFRANAAALSAAAAMPLEVGGLVQGEARLENQGVVPSQGGIEVEVEKVAGSQELPVGAEEVDIPLDALIRAAQEGSAGKAVEGEGQVGELKGGSGNQASGAAEGSGGAAEMDEDVF